MHGASVRLPARVAALCVVVLPLVAGCGAGPTPPAVLPELAIIEDALPPAIPGETYAAAVHAEGGDRAYDWAITSGALPPGLALSIDDLGEADHAIIAGVPEQVGQFQFVLTVTSGDGQSASRAFTIAVAAPAPLVIESPAIPPALAGSSYNIGLRATGGAGQTFEWVLVEGALPAGLELTAGGRIQGTPTGADTAVFTVEVRSASQAARRAYRLAVVPPEPNRFNITIFPVTGIPSGVIPHLEAAVAEWEAAITASLPPVTIPTSFFQSGHCGGFGELINGASTDDVLIIVSIRPIDGPGGVLGQAGPCGLRGETALPFAGSVILDSDDLAPLMGNETLTYIISHEIAHVLGFGTIWSNRGLIEGAGSQDPRFVGPIAVQEFNALGPTGTVPVENQGGAGTRDGHWRQTVFGDERMTGFAARPGVFQPLSRVSLASFIDLGYAVDLSAADSFTLAAALGAAGEAWEQLGHDEILLEPIRVLYPDGRTRTIQPR
jgi:hypothetical protein